MKIDRLLGIVTILMQRDRVTAPELAERFEVSRRTIQRDIEAICMAGIPVVTSQGGGGGISIAEGYKLDKSLLSADELRSIIAGLKSVGSVTGGAEIERLISKLSPGNGAVVSARDSMVIDLASHYKESLSNKIGMINAAISENRLISFDYYSEKGISRRAIEPYFITFKWTAWYVFGYCRLRNDFRLFKLNRLWRYALSDEHFEPRKIPDGELDTHNYFSDGNRVTILFDRSVEYRLAEDYGLASYETTKEGKLKLTVGYSSREFLKSWLLGFGDKAKVLEPPDLAEEIKGIAKNILSVYEHDI
jgi:predicted DNA-binding transcriptional regulator YafY